jgi:hypothetical protein
MDVEPLKFGYAKGLRRPFLDGIKKHQMRRSKRKPSTTNYDGLDLKMNECG